MPSPIVPCYACLFDIPRGPALFVKGGVDLEEGVGGGLGGVKEGETAIRMLCKTEE